MHNEGYIKFKCIRKNDEINIPEAIWTKLCISRKKLWDLKLIGIYPDGTGFGNISVRADKSNKFYITGSRTGKFSELHQNNCALVTDWSYKENRLFCTGKIDASSESLSHAVIYENAPLVNAVVHIHNLRLWDNFQKSLPITDPSASFGTTDMAMEIKKIVTLKPLSETIIMGGHKEGLITYGKDIERVGEKILNLYYQLNKKE